MQAERIVRGKKMVGFVDVGGGLRGIYGAGVLDFCMDHGIQFDMCAGVSAGSANIAAYAAGQRGRNYRYFIEYSFRKEYLSFSNFIRKGSVLDMDYIYGTLFNSDGEDPLDFPALRASGIPLTIVTTSALTGKAVYFTEKDLKQDHYDVIKASCSLPIVNRPYPIQGVPYYDGGLSDPIPYQILLDAGCDRVVVVLTKPLIFQDRERFERIVSNVLRRKYPAIAALLANRNRLYREQLKAARKLAAENKLLLIAPKTIYNMQTLTKDKVVLQKLYDDAQKDAAQMMAFIG